MSDLAKKWLASEIKFTESQQVGVFITKLAKESICNQSNWVSEELTIALNTLSADMHTKSKRPCSTCALVSNAIGKRFGCSVINGYRLPEPPQEKE